MLNTKALALVVLEKKIFSIISLQQILMPPGARAWSLWTPGAWLAGFMKGTTKHCYIQNIEALGLVISEKIFFMFFPIVSLWELSVAMETTILIQSVPKPNAVNPPYPAMVHIKFDQDWPTIFKDIAL